jgi:hypothetical protein
MGNKRKSKTPTIKDAKKQPKISLENSHEIDYPVFSFKYLQESSISDCNNHTFFREFLFRLKKLSELGWKEIRTSDKHSFGTEIIRIDNIIPTIKPSILTPDVTHLTVFRATGSNHSFLGINQNGIFHIIYIEAEFGDIYNH